MLPLDGFDMSFVVAFFVAALIAFKSRSNTLQFIGGAAIVLIPALYVLALTGPGWLIICAINQGFCW